MLTDDVKRMKNPLDRFLYWISERWFIFQRRLAGNPPPWTIDDIFIRYRFCNIRRIADKTSTWLLEHWYKPFFNHPNMLLACSLARFINLPSTLGVIGFPRTWEPATIKEVMRGLRKVDGRIGYSQAYMIPGRQGEDKIEAIVDYFLQPLVNNPPEVFPDSMRKTWGKLWKNFGFGMFIAGQVVADLRWAMKGNWADKETWGARTPDAVKGMNRLLGKPSEDKEGNNNSYSLDVFQFQEGLNQIIRWVRERIPPHVLDGMEGIDFVHCLHEWNKYEEILWGESTHKLLFKWEPRLK